MLIQAQLSADKDEVISLVYMSKYSNHAAATDKNSPHDTKHRKWWIALKIFFIDCHVAVVTK